jgi:hypothetical protein
MSDHIPSAQEMSKAAAATFGRPLRELVAEAVVALALEPEWRWKGTFAQLRQSVAMVANQACR